MNSGVSYTASALLAGFPNTFTLDSIGNGPKIEHGDL